MNILLCKWDRYYLEAALNKNLRVWQILDAYDRKFANVDEQLLARCQGVLNVRSFDSLEEASALTATLISDGVVIDQVIGNGEYSMYGASVVRSILKNNSGSALKTLYCRDKRVMKHKLQAFGVRTARFSSVPDIEDYTSVLSRIKEVGLPFVIKPANGVGTRLTQKINTYEELKNYCQSIGSKIRPPIYSKHFIVEEFIAGEEFHVDGIWAKGGNICFSVGRYHAPCIQYEDTFYGSMLLDDMNDNLILKELYALNKKVNSALNITDGPTHMEVFLDSAGKLVVSEIANRIGGGFIMEANEEKTGTCFRTEHVNSFLYPEYFSEKKKLTPDSKKYVGFINLTPKESGIISSIPSQSALNKYPGVLRAQIRAQVGDYFHLEHGANWIVMLVLAAHSEREYQELCQEIIKTFPVQISRSREHVKNIAV